MTEREKLRETEKLRGEIVTHEGVVGLVVDADEVPDVVMVNGQQYHPWPERPGAEAAKDLVGAKGAAKAGRTLATTWRTPMTEHWTETDLPTDACLDAVEWCRTQPSLKQAWRVCQRGDWMLWLAGRRKADHVTLVRIACDCAELAKEHWTGPEPAECLRVTRAWCDGQATLADVEEAARAARTARAAEAGARAAARAAWAARAAAAWAGVVTARAAEAAWAAEAAAWAAAAAWEAAHHECARIVRRYWPTLQSMEDSHA